MMTLVKIIFMLTANLFILTSNIFSKIIILVMNMAMLMLILNFFIKNNWFFMMFMLLMAGGLMVLFIYFSSSMKFSISFNSNHMNDNYSYSGYLALILVYTFPSVMNLDCNNSQISMLITSFYMNFSQSITMVMMIIYIMIMMLILIEMISSTKNPFRSF